MDILVSRNPDSGNMETGIPERKPPLIGLINTHKESNECQAQSRFAGHKQALHFMGFSLLSPLKFFVDPKNVDGRNNKVVQAIL